MGVGVSTPVLVGVGSVEVGSGSSAVVWNSLATAVFVEEDSVVEVDKVVLPILCVKRE